MTRDEAIAEGRRKLAAGEFNRLPLRTEPDDLTWDTIHLECGHTAAGTAILSKFLATPDGKQTCNACAREWLKANTDAKNEN